MRKPRFIARVLDNKTIQRVAPQTWKTWLKTTDVYRGTGYTEKPPETGVALVQSPYADWYNLTWGIAPNADMPKWRWMFRARPEIRRGIDTKVILAVGRAFQIECKDNEEIEQYSNKLLDHLNVRDTLQSALTDMLVYGQAYFEKVRAITGEEQEHEQVELASIEKRVEASQVTKRWNASEMDNPDKDRYQAWVADVEKVDEWIAQSKPQLLPNGNIGELIELKPLDPLWMRINRDAFGNITGFVQWGLTPIPQAIVPDKIVFLRWLPKSWAQENAYGMSILMPIQRHVSLLIQAEEDMKVYWHQYAKPMLVVKAGTAEKPYPLPKLQSLQTKFSERQPNTDAIVPGDVTIDVMKAGTGETTATFEAWSDYLREKIYETIGIPSVLMNFPDQSARASDDVSLQAFIAEERMAQDILAEQFMKQVIEPEVRRHFSMDELPTMKVVWPPIVEEDENKKTDRLIKAAGGTFITPNEARLKLGYKPIDDPEMDKIRKQSMTGPASQFSKPEESESERTGAREEFQQKIDKDVPSANQ